MNYTLNGSHPVKIIRHAKKKNQAVVKNNKIVLDENGKVVKRSLPDEISAAAGKAIKRVGLKNFSDAKAWHRSVFIERTNTTISHNKFIILLKDDKPLQVWTGSTNYTAGGIYGQSNVGHIIRDEDVASQYLAYWEKLKDDPKKSRKGSTPATDPAKMGIDDWIEHQQPDLKGPVPTPSTHVIFSPRDTTKMLQWYADRLGEAKSSVHLTAAFGVSQQISKMLNKPGAQAKGKPFLRHILLEKEPNSKTSKAAKQKAKDKGKPVPVDYFDFKKKSANRIAFGDLFGKKRGNLDGVMPLEESLAGLNTFVNYLHTKYLLIDPLSDNPTVISGSANFSDASTDKNDENMLIIQGNTRIADIFLTEFMRLFNHFHSRNQLNHLPDDEFAKALERVDGDAWTKPYYDSKSQEYQERELFA